MAKKEMKRKKGPKPLTLEVDGDWQVAVNKALKKKRPKGGWPKKKKKG